MQDSEAKESVHPLREWRSEKHFTREQLAGMVAANGGQMHARFLEAIENGWRHPGYDLAVILEKITGVSVATLKGYPLKNTKTRGPKKAA